MVVFPWKRGKKKPVHKNTVVTPALSTPKRLPTDTHREYGGELAKEYWKRGVKKL